MYYVKFGIGMKNQMVWHSAMTNEDDTLYRHQSTMLQYHPENYTQFSPRKSVKFVDENAE